MQFVTLADTVGCSEIGQWLIQQPLSPFLRSWDRSGLVELNLTRNPSMLITVIVVPWCPLIDI